MTTEKWVLGANTRIVDRRPKTTGYPGRPGWVSTERESKVQRRSDPWLQLFWAKNISSGFSLSEAQQWLRPFWLQLHTRLRYPDTEQVYEVARIDADTRLAYIFLASDVMGAQAAQPMSVETLAGWPLVETYNPIRP